MRSARRHLFLLQELVKRDFSGRYAGSLLGFLWSFVQPLWQLLLFSFVFSVVVRIRLTDFDVATERFWVFLFCGILPWMAIQEGMSRGATAITDNVLLVKRLQFPSEILVMTVVTGALLHEAIAASLFLGLLGALGELSWRTLPWLLAALPLQAALTLGLGLLLAGIHVFFRDTAQLLGMVLNAWFYLTPIVYPLQMVPEPYRSWVELNPLTALVELYRRALLGGGDVGAGDLALLAVVATVALVGGTLLFRRLKRTFADEI